MLNVILQSPGLDLCLDRVSNNGYAKFYQNIPKSSRDRASFTFSEFEPRQNFDQSQMSFDIGYILSFSETEPRQNLDQSQMAFDIGYILSISMCMQNFITIFLTAQQIGPLSLFQNLELDKAPTDKKCRNLIGYILSLSMCIQNFITIFHSVQEIGSFSLFQNLAFGKASTDDKCHFAIPLARSFQFSAQFYHYIPNGLRVKLHFFQNSNLGKTSTDPKCHLTISWTTSCQYQCVCKIPSQNSTQFKRQGHFHFFRIWSSAKTVNLDRWKKVFLNLLGWILSISMFTQKSIKIFHSVQEIRPVDFFRIWRSDEKCHFAISWARSC